MIYLYLINLLAFVLAVYFYTLSQEETFNNASGAQPDTSENKYKQPKELAPIKPWWLKLYYKISKARYKEKFPLSVNLLVALTDKYHMYQAFFKVTIAIAVVTYQPIISWYTDALAYFLLWSLVFTITFRNPKL